MTARISIFPTLLAGLLLQSGLLCSGRAEEGAVTLERHIKPLLAEYCFDCHNSKTQKGDLDLEIYGDNAKLYENREIWEKVVELVESGEMPPEKKPQPSMEQREQLAHFVDGQLAKFDCKLEPNPGKVTIRRLNRAEYRNTIRDLLKVDYSAEDFPNDEVGYGFDNIGDVLSLPPMLMEKYLAAADEVVSKAIVTDVSEKTQIKRMKAGDLRNSGGAVQKIEGGGVVLASNGEIRKGLEFPETAEYVIRVQAYGEQAGTELPKMVVRLGGMDVQTFDVDALANPKAYEVRARFEKGGQELTIAFVNDFSDPVSGQDRNLYIETVEFEHPSALPALPESHRQLITRMPQPGEEHAVAKEILGNFARRAYRRPVTDAEVERLAGFVDLALKEKGTFLEGIQIAVQATLCSPHFLYRWELDEALKPGEIRDLSDFELASRLSYFLWSSMPDAELFAVAGKGELRKDGNLEKQITRMLQDWRTHGLVNNFAGQWLQTRAIFEMSPDPDVFPKFNDQLREAMKQESELFFEAIVKEDRPVTDLLAADFTYLNERLAGHYGIEGVKGEKMQRITLPKDSPRGGVLTQGAVLMVTSTPTRTAPVIRGKWILEQILGTPPPPPPPDVPPLTEQKQANQSASLRQRLEEHRSRAECSSCHAKMDPLGFALENFDATGAWRDMDGKFPIDASGKMPGGGGKFNGATELKQLLKTEQKQKFVHAFATKMMIYALGRGLEYFDRCAVDATVAGMGQRGDRFSALVAGIVTSEPFQKRKRELAAK